jgi:hypothetical protein
VVEERLTPVWKIGCSVSALCIAAAVGWFWFTLSVVGHDKAVNSRLQMLWSDPKSVPLRTLIPANNRWMENAFIADESREEGKAVAVLILDDHYKSGDYSLRSQSGVIGDEISRAVLCSVPTQAKRKKVSLDEVVRRRISAICGNVR